MKTTKVEKGKNIVLKGKKLKVLKRKDNVIVYSPDTTSVEAKNDNKLSNEEKEAVKGQKRIKSKEDEDKLK